MKKIYIHQIFYDATSRAKIQPGFIPIDNTNSKHSDWFEFWVILNFLRNNTLEEGAWYGFLSPKFFEKTGKKFDITMYSGDIYTIEMREVQLDN